MSKVYIIHENGAWVEPLRARLAELDTPFEEWNLVEGTVPIDEEPPQGVFYNRMSASSYTRDHRFSPEYGAVVLNWLEAHGRRIVNDSRALALEINKAAQYQLLKSVGIRTPKTIVAVGRDAILQAAAEFGGEPVILKPNRGGKGDGVRLFEGVADLRDYLDAPTYAPPVDGISLVQEFIDAPSGSIVRAEYIGGELFYAVNIRTAGGFELCPADVCQLPGDHDGPEFTISQTGGGLAPSATQELGRALSNTGVLVAGVEFIQDRNGDWYAYDINTNTNYNPTAEAEAGVYGMKRLAGYLADALTGNLLAAETDLKIAV